MKGMLNNYFYFTRMERNGALVLLSLCVLLFLSPFIFKLFYTKSTTDFAVFKAEIANFYSEEANVLLASQQETRQLFPFNPNFASEEEFLQLGLSPRVAKTIINYRSKGGKFQKIEDFKKIYSLSETDFLRLQPFIELTAAAEQTASTRMESKTKATASLFSFDPNQATKEELMQLGLSANVAQTIISYRNKGGQFKKAEDLQKIYSLSEQHYTRLEPFIAIASTTTAAEKSPYKTATAAIPASSETVTPLDVNTATAEELQRLRGIGPTLSGRIIKFRESLGGFTTLAQVGETFGLPDSTFQQVKSHLTVTPRIKLLTINTSTADELKLHPYISNKQAQVVVNYRNQHGAFTSIEDVKKVKIFTAEELEKLQPYLSFE